MTKDQFTQAVHAKLNEIGEMFDAKNDQYATNDDPLANFTRGAMLAHGRGDLIGQFEALKDYVEKHIAHVYNNKLDGHKVDESISDIAIYFIIAGVMNDLLKLNENVQINEVQKIESFNLNPSSRIRRIQRVEELRALDGQYVLVVEKIYHDDVGNLCDDLNGESLLYRVNKKDDCLENGNQYWKFKYLNNNYYAFEII